MLRARGPSSFRGTGPRAAGPSARPLRRLGPRERPQLVQQALERHAERQRQERLHEREVSRLDHVEHRDHRHVAEVGGVEQDRERHAGGAPEVQPHDEQDREERDGEAHDPVVGVLRAQEDAVDGVAADVAVVTGGAGVLPVRRDGEDADVEEPEEGAPRVVDDDVRVLTDEVPGDLVEVGVEIGVPRRPAGPLLERHPVEGLPESPASSATRPGRPPRRSRGRAGAAGS